MSICAYHQANIQSQLRVKDEDNEKHYLETIKGYDKESINTFPKLLGFLQMKIYDNPYSDLLGEYFTEHITRGQNGQYFTPEHICELMSQLNNASNQKGKRVLDPACGSGRFLLKFAKHSPDNFFYGADISSTCAKMSVLNFFLNGLRGEVAWMNTLSMEWFGGWHINMNGLGIVSIEKEQSLIWSKPSFSKKPENKPSTKGNQLTLF
ncbi:N-6 DNA methylase [Flavivirga jejuensis]|uniref:site-specific DNA-methyltransferase (adenine-specific) n=1 Tax=Flavivirga jejuensis TaxID=870487 RepID=A0ABT8WRR7_9FLAO|nr:N-6 DNA methylase [Flavivirga jejuensis]MDO5975597.1 N-6 DNA methylase [Flavivirga jejuensis]